MTQYAYTNSDCNDGGWTNPGGGGGGLNADISDVQPLSSGADTNYIKSEEDGSMSSDECTLELGTISNPGSSAASHIVYFRYKGDQGSAMYLDLTVALVQGADCATPGSGTTIASKTVTTSGTFTDNSLILNVTQSGNITDYADIQLRFTRGAGSMDETVFVSQAYFAAPAVPTATEDFRVGDRVKETGTGTTGDISLAGAVTGYQTFVAGIGDDNMTYYVIEDANGTAWETGIGKVTDAGTDLLTRDKVIANSSGTTSKITLSGGTHTIFCGSPSRTEMSDVQIKTTTYTVAQADSTILADSSGGIFTITMPTAAAAYLGLKFLIKKITDDANIVTISSAATDFEDEDGSGYSSSIKLHLQGDYYELMCARVSSSDYRWITTNKYLIPHNALLIQTSTQSIANSSAVAMTIDSVSFEQGVDGDDASNYIKITRKGKYLCGGGATMVSMTTESKYMRVYIGHYDDSAAGTVYWASARARPAYADTPSQTTSVLLDLDVDDTIKLYIEHNHGSARNTGSGTGGTYRGTLWVREVR